MIYHYNIKRKILERSTVLYLEMLSTFLHLWDLQLACLILYNIRLQCAYVKTVFSKQFQNNHQKTLLRVYNTDANSRT